MITEGEYLDANTSFERHLKQDDILAEFLVRWPESRSNDVPLAGGSIYRPNHRPSIRRGSVPCEFEKICFLQLNFSFSIILSFGFAIEIVCRYNKS